MRFRVWEETGFVMLLVNLRHNYNIQKPCIRASTKSTLLITHKHYVLFVTHLYIMYS